jgi:hypothetical protein
MQRLEPGQRTSTARHAASAGRRRRISVTATLLILLIGTAAFLLAGNSVPSRIGNGSTPPTNAAFSYGFDFAQQGPYSRSPSNAAAISAHQVMTSIPGVVEDTSIMDWGLPAPEPSPGEFNLSALAARINLISSTGGIPMITLCAAPNWMKNSTGPETAPTPTHYQDFAALAAKIAQTFPQVKYFVVWNELKGFWNPATNNWNIQQYTEMYNDVYRAIKRVRPDAIVGGPYVATPPYAAPRYENLPTTPHGAWGYLDQRDLDAIRYWLANKAGAQFIAVDGPDFPKTGPVTSLVAATQKYAVVNHWIHQRTSLPIWWMESQVQPENSRWSPSWAAAIRIAALVQAASSGARAMLQWQPEQGAGMPDEGLWTATNYADGGKPTVLAHLLPGVLAVLHGPVTLVPGQRQGVLVASGRGGVIAINATTRPVSTVISGTQATLKPGEVRVTSR